MSDTNFTIMRDGRGDPPISVQPLRSVDPAPDEAIVDVRASTINRGELALLTSRPDGWRPGQDLVGIVSVPAEDGSGPPQGSRVVGMVDSGAWSTRVAAATHRLAILPDVVDFPAGAALGMAGLTALRVLRRAGAVLGRDVLITGAAGGVGHLLTQLATLAGARVAQDEPADAAFDIVLEGVGGSSLNTAIRSVRPDGLIILFGNSEPAPAEFTLLDFVGHENATIRTYFSYAASDDDRADLSTLAELVAQDRLRPQIAGCHDLRDAGAAIEAFRAGGIRGKIILTNAASQQPTA